MAPASFVHLHTHTQFSLLDGACRIPDLVEKAKAAGMPAVAMTDHGNLFGAVHFQRAARAAGLKPILGLETYVAPQSRHDRGGGMGNGPHHLLLLARNEEGWRNLMQLSSIGFLEGFYYKPRIDREVLRRHCAGLIGLSACLKGEVNALARAGRMEEAERAAREYADLFDGHFYLELMDHGLPQEALANERLLDLARRTGLPLVATNDCHYMERAHAKAHDVLLCIQTNRQRDDPKRMRFETDRLHFATPQEMEERFGHVPEALANTLRIAEACDVPPPDEQLRLPRFPLPEPFTSADAYLEHLTGEGVRRRYGEPGEEIAERMRYELDVIRRMGYAGYFLIVRDFIEFARGRGIPVGPGRGSAAGSLVSYAVGITNIDPIRYRLLFERFLNPERVTMPDIDIDISDRGRAEVIRYIVDRYGAESVCQIITFGTMAARAVVRDVGRVLGFSFPEVDRIAKLIPAELKMTLEKALAQAPELRELADQDARVSELLEIARVLEGLTRHASTHAAGVVITPTPLAEHVPLFRGKEGEVTTQWDMVACEQIGLLKIDVLGLRTLTVVEDCLTELGLRGVTIDLDALTYDDPDTYALMARGDTVGVFQFESGGMVEYLRRQQPTELEDLIAMNALYRPGPLGGGMVERFVQRKHGLEPITYEDAVLEPILKSTYGTIVYQEQVLQIAAQMAGYRLGEADILRRAMAKKKLKEMEEQRRIFTGRSAERGIAKDVAARVFDWVAKFAEYGFNRSHSAGYAVLAYQTAYLKAHHPVEFMAATLTSEVQDSDRILALLSECRRLGITILPPDVRASEVRFAVEGGAIRFALSAVKGLGRGAAEAIARARSESGGFRGFFPFCESLDGAALHRKALEALIQAGALDGLGGERAPMMAALPAALEWAAARKRDRAAGQSSLFGGDGGAEPGWQSEPALPQVPAWDPAETLRREKEALGFYLTHHPLDPYRSLLPCLGLTPISAALQLPDGTHLRTAGVVAQVRPGSTRRGEPMAAVTVEDFGGRVEVLVFGEALSGCRSCLDAETPLLITARVATGDRGVKLFADRIQPLADVLAAPDNALHLALRGADVAAQAEEVGALLAAWPEGRVPVYLHIDPGTPHGALVQLRRALAAPDVGLLERLRALLGEAAVRLAAGRATPDTRRVFGSATRPPDPAEQAGRRGGRPQPAGRR